MSQSKPCVTDSEFSLFRSLSNPLRANAPSKFVKPKNPHREHASDTPHIPVVVPSTHGTNSGRARPFKFPPMPHVSEDARESLSELSNQSDPVDTSTHDNHNSTGRDSHSNRMNSEEEVWEKQGLLLELHQFEQQGIKLTRQYSMNDTLLQIKFEYDSIRAQQEQMVKVQFGREALFLFLRGLEYANKRAGPILKLDGWSDSLSQNKSQYDYTLNRIYKQYFRHGRQLSPIMELSFALAGSMFMFHVQQLSGAAKPAPATQGTAPPGDFREAPTPPSQQFGPAGLMSSVMGGMGSMFGGGAKAPPSTKGPMAQPTNVNLNSRIHKPATHRRTMRKPVVFGASEPSISEYSENNEVSRASPSSLPRERVNVYEQALAERDEQIKKLMETQKHQQQFFINRSTSVQNGRSPAVTSLPDTVHKPLPVLSVKNKSYHDDDQESLAKSFLQHDDDDFSLSCSSDITTDTDDQSLANENEMQ